MDIRSTLTALCDAFNAHDLERIMTFFADDCVLEMPRGDKPWGSRFQGKENVRKALASRFEGLPDVHYGNGQHFVDAAAETGMSKWLLTGTTPDGTRKRGPGLRLLYVSRRQGGAQGFLLEDRGIAASRIRAVPLPAQSSRSACHLMPRRHQLQRLDQPGVIVLGAAIGRAG